jgi:transposase-like protein
MRRHRYTAEQIIGKLREAEVALAKGQTVAQVSRTLGITEQTYYRWRQEYGGLKVDQAKRLKDLERENTRLKRAVADLTLDKLILKEAAEGNF